LQRQNAAILLAKMAKDEGNMTMMRTHHTMEVLMSLGGNIVPAKS
jgi:hypothetical protein